MPEQPPAHGIPSSVPEASPATVLGAAVDGPRPDPSVSVAPFGPRSLPATAPGHGRVRIPRSRALPIPRLDAILHQAWEHRLTLVVAPAGAGKTTLLARFAASAVDPVAWYRADAWDRDPVRMLRHLEQALRAAVPALPGGWETLEDALRALETGVPARMLLVVDDLHTLESTDAERALERLIDRAPTGLTIVAAGRVWPDMNLPRFKVAGELLEIGVDDLRFRSWEVEQLYRDFYGQPLPPEELAALTRRTEGWAAGLQLFHLATAGKPPVERRRLLDGLARPAARLTGEYLSRNVIADLPAELREFVIGSSVLGRLTGPLCDELLERTDSALMLRELEARCLFTFPLTEPGAYRYHELFRLHLLGVLGDTLGEQETRRRHHRAGGLLIDAGAIPEALDALCRAESWAAVAALLGRDGSALADGVAAWMTAVPPTLLRNDPWLILARARSLRSQGRFRAAVQAFAEAETAFGESDGAVVATAERQPLLPWLDPDPPRTALGAATGGASAVLRAATVRDPGTAITRLQGIDGQGNRLAAGLAALLAGDPPRAQVLLSDVADRSETPGPVTVAAVIGAGVARALQGDPGGARDIEAGIAGAEALGIEWLERIGRACLSLTGTDTGDARLVAEAAAAAADPWGAALGGLLAGWSGEDAHVRPDLLSAAANGFRRLGAPVLEAWARSLLALALAHIDHPEGEPTAIAADALARTTGVLPARGLAQLAQAWCRDDTMGELADAARATLADAGLGVPAWAAVPSRRQSEGGRPRALATHPDRVTVTTTARPAPGSTGTVDVRCLGPLELVIDGQPVDLVAARPRVRSLLRLLLSEPGALFHHEVIAETFWPDAEPEVGARNLHAAIAALRRLVEPGAVRGSFQLVVREGPGYRFSIAPGSRVDLIAFDAALEAARVARVAGDPRSCEGALRTALELYRGDLLVDEGPASWLEEARELRREQAVAAAEGIARSCLERQRLDEAAHWCTVGLRVDRYHDPLWRLLIAVRERAGDPGAARRARNGYDRMLVELGVTGPG